jgi:hypothetical protein
VSFGNNVIRNWSLTGSGRSGGSDGNASVLVAGAVLTGASCLTAVQLFTSANPLGRCYRFWNQLNRQESSMTANDGTVNRSIDDYSKLHRESSQEDRNQNYAAFVNAYYDLATVFYECDGDCPFTFRTTFPLKPFTNPCADTNINSRRNSVTVFMDLPNTS